MLKLKKPTDKTRIICKFKSQILQKQMAKGLLILFIVIFIIGVLNIAILKLMNLPESKKEKIRKRFWYLYGIVFSTIGLVNMLHVAPFDSGFYLLYVAELGFGVCLIILNYLGKIETKP